jgi:hypothetical protein
MENEEKCSHAITALKSEHDQTVSIFQKEISFLKIKLDDLLHQVDVANEKNTQIMFQYTQEQQKLYKSQNKVLNLMQLNTYIKQQSDYNREQLNLMRLSYLFVQKENVQLQAEKLQYMCQYSAITYPVHSFSPDRQFIHPALPFIHPAHSFSPDLPFVHPAHSFSPALPFVNPVHSFSPALPFVNPVHSFSPALPFVNQVHSFSPALPFVNSVHSFSATPVLYQPVHSFSKDNRKNVAKLQKIQNQIEIQETQNQIEIQET